MIKELGSFWDSSSGACQEAYQPDSDPWNPQWEVTTFKLTLHRPNMHTCMHMHTQNNFSFFNRVEYGNYDL